MKPEYDFSRAERGKFGRAGSVLKLPAYANVPRKQPQLGAKTGATSSKEKKDAEPCIRPPSGDKDDQ